MWLKSHAFKTVTLNEKPNDEKNILKMRGGNGAATTVGESILTQIQRKLYRLSRWIIYNFCEAIHQKKKKKKSKNPPHIQTSGVLNAQLEQNTWTILAWFTNILMSRTSLNHISRQITVICRKTWTEIFSEDVFRWKITFRRNITAIDWK